MFSLPKTKQLFFATIVVAYFFVGVFGLLGMVTMSHHDGMSMGGCPFMLGETAICEMSVLDHIASWQVMLAALPPQVSAFVPLLLALLAFGLLRYLYDPPEASQLQSRFSYSASTHSQLLVSLLLVSVISPRAP